MSFPGGRMKYLLLSIIVLAVPAVAHAGDYIRVKQRPFYPGPNAPSQLLADIELTHCCEKKDADVARVYELAKKVVATGTKELLAVDARSTVIEVSYKGDIVKVAYDGIRRQGKEAFRKRWAALMGEIQNLVSKRLSSPHE
jgi:hypothetical protein